MSWLVRLMNICFLPLFCSMLTPLLEATITALQQYPEHPCIQAKQPRLTPEDFGAVCCLLWEGVKEKHNPPKPHMKWIINAPLWWALVKQQACYYPKCMRCLFVALNTAFKALPSAHSRRLDPFERKESTCTAHHSSVCTFSIWGRFKRKSIYKIALRT